MATLDTSQAGGAGATQKEGNSHEGALMLKHEEQGKDREMEALKQRAIEAENLLQHYRSETERLVHGGSSSESGSHHAQAMMRAWLRDARQQSEEIKTLFEQSKKVAAESQAIMKKDFEAQISRLKLQISNLEGEKGSSSQLLSEASALSDRRRLEIVSLRASLDQMRQEMQIAEARHREELANRDKVVREEKAQLCALNNELQLAIHDQARMSAEHEHEENYSHEQALLDLRWHLQRAQEMRDREKAASAEALEQANARADELQRLLDQERAGLQQQLDQERADCVRVAERLNEAEELRTEEVERLTSSISQLTAELENTKLLSINELKVMRSIHIHTSGRAIASRHRFRVLQTVFHFFEISCVQTVEGNVEKVIDGLTGGRKSKEFAAYVRKWKCTTDRQRSLRVAHGRAADKNVSNLLSSAMHTWLDVVVCDKRMVTLEYRSKRRAMQTIALRALRKWSSGAAEQERRAALSRRVQNAYVQQRARRTFAGWEMHVRMWKRVSSKSAKIRARVLRETTHIALHSLARNAVEMKKQRSKSEHFQQSHCADHRAQVFASWREKSVLNKGVRGLGERLCSWKMKHRLQGLLRHWKECAKRGMVKRHAEKSVFRKRGKNLASVVLVSWVQCVGKKLWFAWCSSQLSSKYVSLRLQTCVRMWMNTVIEERVHSRWATRCRFRNNRKIATAVTEWKVHVSRTQRRIGIVSRTQRRIRNAVVAIQFDRWRSNVSVLLGRKKLHQALEDAEGERQKGREQAEKLTKVVSKVEASLKQKQVELDGLHDEHSRLISELELKIGRLEEDLEMSCMGLEAKETELAAARTQISVLQGTMEELRSMTAEARADAADQEEDNQSSLAMALRDAQAAKRAQASLAAQVQTKEAELDAMSNHCNFLETKINELRTAVDEAQKKARSDLEAAIAERRKAEARLGDVQRRVEAQAQAQIACKEAEASALRTHISVLQSTLECAVRDLRDADDVPEEVRKNYEGSVGQKIAVDGGPWKGVAYSPPSRSAELSTATTNKDVDMSADVSFDVALVSKRADLRSNDPRIHDASDHRKDKKTAVSGGKEHVTVQGYPRARFIVAGAADKNVDSSDPRPAGISFSRRAAHDASDSEGSPLWQHCQNSWSISLVADENSPCIDIKPDELRNTIGRTVLDDIESNTSSALADNDTLSESINVEKQTPALSPEAEHLLQSSPYGLSRPAGIDLYPEEVQKSTSKRGVTGVDC